MLLHIATFRSEALCQIVCGCCKQTFFSAERLKLHLEMGICKFFKAGEKSNQTPLKSKSKVNIQEIREELDKSYSDVEAVQSVIDLDDKDFDLRNEGKKKKGARKLYVKRGPDPSTEQLSISISIELVNSLNTGRAPYMCVIPSCNARPYPTRFSLRRHYITHDPEIYANIVCPICGWTKGEEHPGLMRKHIMDKHDKTQEWAQANIIYDTSEKMKAFRKATYHYHHVENEKVNKDMRTPGYRLSRKNACLPGDFTECIVDLDDPLVRASFNKVGQETGWICGLPHCGMGGFKTSTDLKHHYGRHDATLRKDFLECNLCSYTCWQTKEMNVHQKADHPDMLFLAASTGEPQYKKVQGDRWKSFTELVREMLPTKERRDPDFDTIHKQCNFCSESFNTQNSLEDHNKIHRPQLISPDLICPQCQEGFAVQSVFDNHVRGHSVPYEFFSGGVIRCNGCSQHFSKVKYVKTHLSIHHMSLLESFDFCEHCSDFFTNKTALKKHMFEHTDTVKDKCSQDLTCNQCEKVFSDAEDMRLHQRIHKDKTWQYQCTVCKSLYSTRSLMHKHVKYTHKVKNIEDRMDYIKFYSKEEAKLLDVELLNAKKPKGRGGVPGSVKYPCPFGCGANYSKNGLKLHKGRCEKKDKETGEELEYDGEVSHGSEERGHVYQYNLPVHFLKSEND